MAKSIEATGSNKSEKGVLKDLDLHLRKCTSYIPPYIVSPSY